MNYETSLALLDDLPVGLILADEHDVTVLYNREAQRIFGRTPARVAEILGTSVVDCHPPKSWPMVQQLLDDFRAGRRDELDGVKDVNGRAIRFTYRPVRAPDGTYLGTVEIVREVGYSNPKPVVKIAHDVQVYETECLSAIIPAVSCSIEELFGHYRLQMQENCM